MMLSWCFISLFARIDKKLKIVRLFCFSTHTNHSKKYQQLFYSFFLNTRPCPLLALLVNPRLQGLRPLQPVLAKSHLFLANIEQIQKALFIWEIKRKNEICKHLFGYFSIILAQISPNGLRYGRLAHRI